MKTFQLIKEDDIPKYAILPYGDDDALEDYMEEIWAYKAISRFNAKKSKKFIPMAEVMAELEKAGKTKKTV